MTQDRDSSIYMYRTFLNHSMERKTAFSVLMECANENLLIEKLSELYYARRKLKDLKTHIVNAMGGKCVICKYNKCNRALDLHHLNPNKKEFSFSKIIASPRKWEIITKELKKCVLLCNRCHQEVHEGITKIPKNVTKFNNQYKRYKEIQKTNKCLICGKLKPIRNKTCSHKCAGKSRSKINWDKINLKELLIKHKSYLKVGDILGVSDVAVRKQINKLSR